MFFALCGCCLWGCVAGPLLSFTRSHETEREEGEKHLLLALNVYGFSSWGARIFEDVSTRFTKGSHSSLGLPF